MWPASDFSMIGSYFPTLILNPGAGRAKENKPHHPGLPTPAHDPGEEAGSQSLFQLALLSAEKSTHLLFKTDQMPSKPIKTLSFFFRST